MKIIKRIIHTFLTVVIIFVLPIVVITLISSKSDILGGIRSFAVLTGSMEPKLPVGSIVYTQKRTWYPIGSVITFTHDGVTVTHRIVDIINKDNVLFYTTRGDANNTNDSHMIQQSEVLGKEIISLPYVGRIIAFIKSPIGFLSLIILPIIIFIGLEFWNLKKEFVKEVEKRMEEKFRQEHIVL
jgi:signal peptidase